MNQVLFNKIKNHFFTLLEAKTGWGKEEVKRLYLQAAAEVMVEWIDYTDQFLPPITVPESDKSKDLGELPWERH